MIQNVSLGILLGIAGNPIQTWLFLKPSSVLKPTVFPVPSVRAHNTSHSSDFPYFTVVLMKGQGSMLEGSRALVEGDARALLGCLCQLTTVKPLKCILSTHTAEKRGKFPLEVLAFCR